MLIRSLDFRSLILVTPKCQASGEPIWMVFGLQQVNMRSQGKEKEKIEICTRFV